MTRTRSGRIVESAQRSPVPVSGGTGTGPKLTASALVVAISFTLFAGVAAVVVVAPRAALARSVGSTGSGSAQFRDVASWQISAPIDGPDQTSSPVVSPVSIKIESIGVDSSVIPLGLNADGTVQVPVDTTKVGWYTGNVAPGANGASVLIGHLDSKTGPAVFYKLARVKPGAVIAIRRANGTTARFSVQVVSRFRRSVFPTRSVYGPVDGSQLRLVTCGGEFDRESGHYLDNTVVYASLLGITAAAPVVRPAARPAARPAPQRSGRAARAGS